MKTVVVALVTVAVSLPATPHPSWTPALGVAHADAAECSRPPERVRAPDGLADARMKFRATLDNGRRVQGWRFDARTVRDVAIVVDWRHLDGTHVQRLAVYAPDGTIYRAFTRGFAGLGRRASSVETVLLVSGTAITQTSLLGEWCVETYLDSETAPIARQRFFLLAGH